MNCDCETNPTPVSLENITKPIFSSSKLEFKNLRKLQSNHLFIFVLIIEPVTSSPETGVSQPRPALRSFFFRPAALISLSSPTRRGGADSITSPGSSSSSARLVSLAAAALAAEAEEKSLDISEWKKGVGAGRRGSQHFQRREDLGLFFSSSFYSIYSILMIIKRGSTDGMARMSTLMTRKKIKFILVRN